MLMVTYSISDSSAVVISFSSSLACYMVHIFIYYRYEKYKPAGVSDQCYTDVVHTIRSFYIGKQWAVESKLHIEACIPGSVREQI